MYIQPLEISKISLSTKKIKQRCLTKLYCIFERVGSYIVDNYNTKRGLLQIR